MPFDTGNSNTVLRPLAFVHGLDFVLGFGGSDDLLKVFEKYAAAKDMPELSRKPTKVDILFVRPRSFFHFEQTVIKSFMWPSIFIPFSIELYMSSFFLKPKYFA